MSTWLYQMDAAEWPPETFRHEIWEGRSWRWERRKMKSAAGVEPEVGDTIVFYYCRTNCPDDWGIYGWAVLDRYDAKLKRLHFTPSAPTNWLKMDPWRDDESEKQVQCLANDIRGRMYTGTLFLLTESEHIESVRRGIRRHLSGF